MERDGWRASQRSPAVHHEGGRTWRYISTRERVLETEMEMEMEMEMELIQQA